MIYYTLVEYNACFYQITKFLYSHQNRRFRSNKKRNYIKWIFFQNAHFPFIFRSIQCKWNKFESATQRETKGIEFSFTNEQQWLMSRNPPVLIFSRKQKSFPYLYIFVWEFASYAVYRRKKLSNKTSPIALYTHTPISIQ